MAGDPCTVLSGCYVKGVLNVRLRFGEPQHVEQLRDGLTHYTFMPGQRFGFMWWARLSPRRQVAGFAVAEALRAGEFGYRIPCVQPVVQVHAYLTCRCVGQDRGVVGRAEDLIREIQQAEIDPSHVPPVYYRLASQALRVRHEPRRLERHELDRFLEEQSDAD